MDKSVALLLILSALLSGTAGASPESPGDPESKAEAAADPAGRRDRIYAALGASATSYIFYGDTATTVSSLAGALWVGWQRQYRPRMGLRAGAFMHLGPTQVVRDMNDSSRIILGGRYETHGEGGRAAVIETQVQAVFGPFAHLTLEPGVNWGLGWHTADSIPTEGSGRRYYSPPPHFSFLGGLLGASLGFGRFDRFAVTAQGSLGKVLGRPQALAFALGAGLRVAIRI